LSHPEGIDYSYFGFDSPHGHIIYQYNAAEFFRTATNLSDVNQVYLSDGYAVLGSAKPPIDLDFRTTSSASKTACKVVTGLCGAFSTVGYYALIKNEFNFVCNASTAGLKMTGNFLHILAPDNSSGHSTGREVSDSSSPDGHVHPENIVLE